MNTRKPDRRSVADPSSLLDLLISLYEPLSDANTAGLIKPTSDTVANPDQLLNCLIRFYDAAMVLATDGTNLPRPTSDTAGDPDDLTGWLLNLYSVVAA